MRYTYSLNDLYFRKPEMSFEAWLEQNPHLEKGDFDPRNLYDGYAQEHEHQGFVVGGDHIRGLLIADPICIEDMFAADTATAAPLSIGRTGTVGRWSSAGTGWKS